MKNPFLTERETEYVDTQSRIEIVKTFTAIECEAALKLPDLQKTVRQAIERRLRKLEKIGL